MSPVKYEIGFYIPESDILHSHRREKLKSYIGLSTVFCATVTAVPVTVCGFEALKLALLLQQTCRIACSARSTGTSWLYYRLLDSCLSSR
jgi:hypothetical protein